MRILQIITTSDVGGAQEYLHLFGKNIKKENHFILTSPDGDFENKFNNISKKVFLVRSLVRKINLIKDFKSFLKIRNIISKNEFDIIESHTAKASFLTALALKTIKNKPIFIYNAHGFDASHIEMNRFADNFFKKLKKYICNVADTVIVVSNNTAQNLIKENICEKEKISVIPGGVNKNRFKNLSVPVELKNKRKILIGASGRLVERKGFEYLVKAAKIIKEKSDKSIEFILIGEGPLEQKIKELIKVYGLKDIFRVISFKDNFPDYLNMFDIFVIPSLNEGFPLITLEALYLGIPVVSTPVSGMKEAFNHGEQGLFVEKENEKVIADAILKLLENNDLRICMSEKAHELAINKYSDKRVYEDHLKLFEKLLEESKLNKK
ncbi:glycosyltransferase [Halanaerobium sp.]|uniref:glycosyltransferase n=1 Tax=Halanaerobium sp. TaxID=1895664 RepID=UPI000DE6A9C6|nr:glycosyltransferase [Halanaerobium sp.]PUU89885.1 MAG: group 1 glycosyl transferase [Halanaerobium sp.]